MCRGEAGWQGEGRGVGLEEGLDTASNGESEWHGRGSSVRREASKGTRRHDWEHGQVTRIKYVN